MLISDQMFSEDASTYANLSRIFFTDDFNMFSPLTEVRERSNSVVECLTRDRGAAGSSLTGVTALCP